MQVTGLVRRDGGAAGIEYICEMASLYPQAVANVELSAVEAQLTAGNDLQLTANVIPSYADDLSITWSSSDDAVATVDESGNVHAVSEGACDIRATSVNGRYDECHVAVE